MHSSNQTLAGEIPATISSTFIFIFSFLPLMMKKEEDMVIQRTNEKSFEARISFVAKVISIQGFHSIYRWKRSRTNSNSNFQSPKNQLTSRDFRSTESANDQPSLLKHETLPFSHYISRFEETQDLILEKSTRPCDIWQPVVQPAIKSWRSAFMIQILILPRTSKALKSLLPTPLFWLSVSRLW